MESDTLLDQLVGLLLEEVDLVDVDLLELEVVLFEVGNVFDDLLEDVVGRFSCVVLQRCALGSEQLHLFFVIVKHFAGFFGAALIKKLGVR